TSEDLVTLEEPKPKNPYGLLTFLAICIFGAILIFMNQKDQSIQVEIKSIPTDANVYFDNKLLGSTPLVYVTESERELRIEKQGFETQTLTISPRIPQTTIKLIPLPKPKAPTQEKETVSPKEEPPKTEPKTKTKTVTKTKSNRRKPPQNKELIDPWE
ncbi:MAG: PEGA domain-containing protein, partial [Myxococcota bacterium]|nr:PEGA domain-containing protein [Myxococcota bacterium]